jgi:hypothetical protein
MSCALGQWLAAPAHTVIRCELLDKRTADVLNAEWKKFEPNVATFAVDDHSAQELSKLIPLLQSLERSGAITIYRCENFTCALPQTAELVKLGQFAPQNVAANQQTGET